jgi:hypothetical protein
LRPAGLAWCFGQGGAVRGATTFARASPETASACGISEEARLLIAHHAMVRRAGQAMPLQAPTKPQAPRRRRSRSAPTAAPDLQNTLEV